MDTEPTQQIYDVEPIDAADDPVVLAYRIKGPKSFQGVVRVRKSELAKDPSLIEISKSAMSLGFDFQKSLNALRETPRPADPYVERKIQYKLMTADIKARVREEKITFETLAKDIHEIRSMNDQAAHFVLALVTDQLKKEGLWRDEDKDLTMSEAFPLSQAKVDPRYSRDDLMALQRGTFLSDSDLTHEDRAADKSKAEMLGSGVFRLPALATPMLHNLMRASPRDLYHQIARRMIDSRYFEDNPNDAHLYRACYFASRGVEDEAHFEVLIKAGLGSRYPHYTFDDYRIERIPLRSRLRHFIENFFSENPLIQRRLKNGVGSGEHKMQSVWKRFYTVWDSLTRKQQEALEKVYMDQDPLTKTEAAQEFGITVDSLISRLKTAFLKFKAEFAELEGITPKRLPRSKLAGSVTHNGMWRYQSAAWRSQLKRVDPKTNIATKIDWHKLPKSKNLDWKTVARIKAEIIENCPVPYIHDTEYFDGMKPTIISFGRAPGNLAPEVDVDPDDGFRHIE